MTFQHNGIKLPLDQDNDEQAAVLYSPFRSKTVNPSSWNSKMRFWKNFLEKTASERKLITVDIHSLPQLFLRKGLTPKCLPAVFEDLHRDGKVKPIEDYKRSKSWVAWGFTTLVKDPLSWGVSQIFGSPKKTPTIFVWPEVLKVVSEDALFHLQSKIRQGVIKSVLPYSRLDALLAEFVTSKDYFDLVLNHLQSENKISLQNTDQHGLLVKVCEREKTSVPSINATDVQVFEINEAHTSIENELSTLLDRMDELTSQAREHVKNTKRAMALRCLRKKKQLDKTFQLKSSLLHNLEEILCKIEEAETNQMVVQACETGLAALKKMNQETTIDKVETVMGAVQEAIEDTEDVNAAVSSIGSDPERDALLEEELAALLKDDEKQAVPCDDLSLPDLAGLSLSDLDFPQVPTHSPSSSPKEAKPSRQQEEPSRKVLLS